jgi:benzoyl-CoA reductase subunit BamC
MCEGEDMPLCVEWCLNDVLIYEEREEEVDEEVLLDEMETGLEALMEKFGRDKVESAMNRMSRNG